ncbi:Dolichyl-diphosphooligosaccharide--protein glycosyltransferase subunit 1 [Entamoeba marina]
MWCLHFLTLFCFLSSASITNSLVLVDLDLTTVFPTVQYSISAQSVEPTTQYNFTIPSNSAISGLSFSELSTETKLTYKRFLDNDLMYYTVEIPESTSIHLTAKFSHHSGIVPMPAQISQFDISEAHYYTTICPVSPYHTKSCQVVIHHTGPFTVLSEEYDHNPIDNATTVGPINDIEPLHETSFIGHYYPHPSMKITQLIHRIDLPTIGNNVAIEDNYNDLINNAAKVVDGFSRFDFQENVGNYPNAIGFFEIAMDRRADNIFYKDVSGNISTSAVQVFDENITLVTLPRFPLLGGWKTSFTVGYEVPKSVMVSSGKVTITLPQMKYGFVEEMVVKVLLPDSATFKSVDVDAEVTHIDVPSFLSFTSRTEVTITLKNINIMETTNIDIFYTEALSAGMNKMITFGAYIVVLAITFFVFIKLSA